jgi:hypothetical protein
MRHARTAGTFPLIPSMDDPKHLPKFEQWMEVFRNSIPSFR